jgi:signal peptidase I
MPLTQHTLPVFECKSYIEWPQWKYRRVKGLGNVKLNDIVVFNYPAGDTICSNVQYQTEYYRLVYDNGEGLYGNTVGVPDFDSLNSIQVYDLFKEVYNMGSNYVRNNRSQFGEVSTRPTDRRENYVKRCVGLPGDTLQIKNKVVFINGKANKEPDNVQYTYFVKLNNVTLTKLLGDEYEPMRKELGISEEDLQSLSRLHGYDVDNNLILNDNVKQYDGYMPLTHKAAEELKKRGVAKAVVPVKDTDIYGGMVYPLNAFTGWTRDNYGPIWIPKKGQTIRLTLENLPIYERCIRVYEGNDLQTKGRQIFINGQKADRYTFKLDYYWMQGDNRHNSADSRYWGFVPEDHIVGKPLFIWWSSDPDRNGLSGVRWNRLFRWVDNIK